jgi:hypothetical protein
LCGVREQKATRKQYTAPVRFSRFSLHLLDFPLPFESMQGLAKVSGALTKSLLSMEMLLLLGVYSHIPHLHQFSVIACISVFVDFILQVCT